MAKQKRILICEFSQETNSFNPNLWGMDKFRALLCCGSLVMRLVFTFKKSSPVGGMLSTLRCCGAQVICGIAMRAGSGGPVEDTVLDHFIQKTCTLIQRRRSFDIILLSLHGATATPAYPDASGHILSAIRAAVGQKTIISVACDMHANITQQVKENADFICGYQTYPHIDFFETGSRAASLSLRKLKGESLHTASIHLRMIVPASGYSTRSGALEEIMALGSSACEEGSIEDYTVFLVQPWLDVNQISSCALVVSHDEKTAKRFAGILADALYAARDSFQPELESVYDILHIANNNKTGKPVVLGDAADSPNAGAPGDSTYVISQLIESGLPVTMLTCVADCTAAQIACAKGPRANVPLQLGGESTSSISPVIGNFTVHSVHDGRFRLAGPAGKGLRIRLGKTAVLELNNLTVLVCESPMMCGDLNFYRAFGLDPSSFQLVVIKANTSFRENYARIASSIHVADTPGAASADLLSLPFRNLPEECYPFQNSIRMT